MIKAYKKFRRLFLAFSVVACASLSLPLAGCGDDGGAAPPPGGRPGAAAKKGKKRGKKPRINRRRLIPIGKVAKRLRHNFTDRDFQPDASGELNRDPFRSYIVGGGMARKKKVSMTTDICTPRNTRAPTYSLRGLRLIGIVLRGTKQFALFRDSRSYGHIVHRGDCLGKEKAVVDDIGAGFVRLQVTPDAPQGTAAPPPQTRQIALYPKELTIEPEAGDDGDSDVETVDEN